MNLTKHTGKIIDKKDGFKIVDCSNCGFIHIFPFPTEKDLKQFYEQEFYQHERPNYFIETKEDLPWWMATYNNYYKLFEKYTNGRRLLDIGSGPGHFLLCGKNRGWETVGIEPSAIAAQYSNNRKLKTINDFFDYDRAKKLGKFDVVHAALVLEHIPNPIKFIIDMEKMLKKGGHLAIFCPNDYNPLQKILCKEKGFQPWWVVPKHHINYFTTKNMQKLLEKLGLKVEIALGTFPLEIFPLSGKNYVDNHLIGRACHKERKMFETLLYKKNPDILNNLYQGLAEVNLGREFLIIAKKIK